MNISKFFFSQRVIDESNNFDDQTLNAISINSFKNKIGKLFEVGLELQINLKLKERPPLQKNVGCCLTIAGGAYKLTAKLIRAL